MMSPDEVVEAALRDGTQRNEPSLASLGFYPALVLGDRDLVEEALHQNPGLATTPGGPRDWQPLLYVCFSRIPNQLGLAATAQSLLERGADPNATYLAEGRYTLSCLYGATGLNNNPALTRVLLDAETNPNDGESVYHSTEHRDLACLKLLLAAGASLDGTNALKHMLDREDLTGLNLLLKAGADPNEVNGPAETALHWAVWRGRSEQTIAALLDHGADIDARRFDGRTAYAMAYSTGQVAVASLLADRGADTTITGTDLYIGDILSASPDECRHLLDQAPNRLPIPESASLLPELASRRQVVGVRALLAAGAPIDTPGEHGGTALHWACWKGYPEIVKLLLEQGASLTVKDHSYQATPSGWLEHGRQNCHEPGGDYPAVARLLESSGFSAS